jgi:hypothetical protein
MNEAIAKHSEVVSAAECVAAEKTGGRLRKAASAIATAILLTGIVGTAHAEKIVFDFNLKCFFHFSCTPVEKIGTLALSNSTVDPNRVDFMFSVSSPIVRLDRLYLNYAGLEVNAGARYVSIVEVNAAPGVLGDETGNSVWMDHIGAAAWFDISVDLHRSPAQFSGSLVLGEPVAFNGRRPVNLDAAMFDTKDPDSWIYAELIGATPETMVWYVATVSYRLSYPDVLPIGHINLTSPPEVLPPPDPTQSSAALIQADVPEPGTLGLLGLAAGFLAGAMRRRKRSGE